MNQAHEIQVATARERNASLRLASCVLLGGPGLELKPDWVVTEDMRPERTARANAEHLGPLNTRVCQFATLDLQVFK